MLLILGCWPVLLRDGVVAYLDGAGISRYYHSVIVMLAFWLSDSLFPRGLEWLHSFFWVYCVG